MDARAWLRSVKSLFCAGGRCIVESPNFENHPQSSLSAEHFLRFSEPQFQALVETIHLSEAHASRPNEMVGVFELQDPSDDHHLDPNTETWIEHVATARRTYQEAMADKEAESERWRALATAIADAVERCDEDVTVCFWVANDYATGIAKELPEPTSLDIRLIDNAESKIGTSHAGSPTPIQAPEFDLATDSQRLFILCSPNWNDDIHDQITDLNLDESIVIAGVEWTTGDGIDLPGSSTR